MKKIISLLIVFTIILTTGFVVKADDIGLEECRQTMEYFIDGADPHWLGFDIYDQREVYDENLEEHGYLFELSNGQKEGYGIVLSNGTYTMVAEASYDKASPYKGIDKTSKIVYTSPLNYYVKESTIGLLSIFDTGDLRDIVTDRSVNPEDLYVYDFFGGLEYSDATTRAVPTEERYGYIDDLDTEFEFITQRESDCIPTSMAMCLKYLHNIGTITLSMTNIYSIRNKINSYMCNGDVPCYGGDVIARNAINTFGSNYSTPKISTRGDGFWGDLTFFTIIDEIDDNCPMVMMFNAEILASINHATACVGYYITYNPQYPAILYSSYTIVKDPNSSSSTNVTIAWNGTNIHGYYLVYIG